MNKLLCAGLLWSTSAWAGGLTVTTEDASPLNYSTDDGKSVVGSATEAVQEMFKRAKLEHTVTLYPWMRAITMARTDRIHKKYQ